VIYMRAEERTARPALPCAMMPKHAPTVCARLRHPSRAVLSLCPSPPSPKPLSSRATVLAFGWQTPLPTSRVMVNLSFAECSITYDDVNHCLRHVSAHAEDTVEGKCGGCISFATRLISSCSVTRARSDDASIWTR
jgi:hypothetical protein